MIFNSLVFLLFFSMFFILYWVIFERELKYQNILLLIGSYFFYAWTDWRLLSYLVVVTVLNYVLGLLLEKEKNPFRKRFFLYVGLVQGVGGLLYFKYFNFFIESFNELFSLLNVNLNFQTLSIIVPIGISFFTFRLISYLLDIDKGKINATKDWIVFFNYVSFFPSLLSGPIDKAKLLVPQLEIRRKFDHAQISDGLRQILWGLFKKAVIADNIATITNPIFDNYLDQSGSALLLGAFLYTIQIYADFSGYTDMAIGVARLLGFKITKNFDFPYFAQNIAEFWRKWHMSLTMWLTEYVFTPISIALRDFGKLGIIVAIVVNFTIVGIWHGANWTYILFGFLHGLYFIPLIIRGTMNKRKKTNKNKLIPSLKEFINILATFILVMFTFIMFRASSVEHAVGYFINIFSTSIFSIPEFLFGRQVLLTIMLMGIFMLIEWYGRSGEYAIERLGLKWKTPLRWGFYYLIILAIYLFTGNQQQFIYFQF